MTSPYLTSTATAASGNYHDVSSVPERFRESSRPVPGKSVVPPEYQGTSNPEIAKTTFTDARPVTGKSTAEPSNT